MQAIPTAPASAASPDPAEVRELRPGSSPTRAVEQPVGKGSGQGKGKGAGLRVDAGRLPGTRLTGSELGMATAEYAIATLAAVGFAGLLVVILRSDEVRGFLLNLIRTALALP